jgi:gas vesicle protein
MSEYERQDRGLAYEPSAQNSMGSETREKTPEEIEREIELTRSRMSRDIDELGDRLSPENLKQEAKSAIKSAAQGAVSNVGESALRTGSRLVDAIRENPLPVIAVGAGVTWLLTRRSNEDISGNRMAKYAYTGPDRRWQEGSGIKSRLGDAVSGIKDKIGETASDISEKASGLAEGTQERIGEFGGQARRQTRRMKTNLEHTSEENPLLLALGATIAGLALGLLLPGTERENELMGSKRDQLMDRAEQTAERVKEAAVEAGREVKETVRSEVKERAPEIKEAVQQAGQQVKEQVRESAKRVKSEAKDAAKDAGKKSGGSTGNQF